MGSVKDLKIIQQPQPEKPGIGRFFFSDRYSVFDWGEMPDLIANKGKALCIMGAYFFEKLEKMGIKTHYQGMVHEDNTIYLSDLTEPVDTMQVALVNVIKPVYTDGRYDYSAYSPDMRNILIPLEIIYRNSLPAGSSVFRRIKAGSLRLEELGLQHMPEPNHVLKEPLIDASTKLEVTDRYLSWGEAREISALEKAEMETLKITTIKIDDMITEHIKSAGLKNEDGKVEYAFDSNRQIMLVDVLGTPDECRFTYTGMPVSKELARIHYRNTSWYDEVEQAKQTDRINWKMLVKNPPPRLPAAVASLLSQLYQGTCNEITQREWFKAPPLQKTLGLLKEQIKL